ncbi:ABC transporter ATP-binding protein [Tepidimicrobium xylanilyticum]|uniref:Putative ABC transport system ATP-binding protein n=1 Tax=Tepidimicrobium xylanilyticum TaxID=1123352 RepID=A0A1H3EQK9_9FIRM|nr:ATP-binding cassette domain-containing protein [Tepidimicrobium xylanilyticum]GMG97405.1 ABC transporter ATP-binding protein [Tepidimicrobium xylanilyticum]SDX80408.1 putative ABC transport system ATP-binding protein [Tepidimicrobium xylanilyticum]
MLKLINISKTFNKGNINEQVLFKDFSLDINKGDFISLIGSNGAGKSTLLNIISGKVKADEGNIFLNGVDITAKDEFERCRNISRIFQDPSMGTNPSMTIYENLAMANNKGKKFGLKFLIDKKDEEFFRDSLRVLGLNLEGKLHSPVSQLSGGQRQSLALIMSTIGNPDLLLLDEHTAALDPKTSEIVMDITDKVVREKGVTTIMVTHNIEYAIKYGNRLIMLHLGKKVLDISGDMKKNLTKEELLSLFKNISDKSLFA